jgi:hypothetical protein
MLTKVFVVSVYLICEFMQSFLLTNKCFLSTNNWKKKTHQKKSLSDEQNLWKKNLTHEQTYWRIAHKNWSVIWMNFRF